MTRFCLAMEEHRRTDAGRVRTARELVMSFFPYDESSATDRVFKLIPNEVRGPVLSGWGIRGTKAALKDDDERVKSVVHDALVAGDIDENIFEGGLTPSILIDWVALADWWAFWRHGKLTGVAIQKALATARALDLIDDRWFFANLQGRGGKLKGTDVVCDALSKDQVVTWIRKVHESGDGTPAGLVTALGWETILGKTAQDALLFALDAFARKVGLAAPEPAPDKAGADVKIPIEVEDTKEIASEVRTEVPSPDDAVDSGLPVAIPDIPAIDSADDEERTADHDDAPTPGKPPEQGVWGPSGESPKLLEARAKMMEMLGTPLEKAPAPAIQEAWSVSSDVPEKPSALEWPEPPANAGVRLDEPKQPPPPTFPKKVPLPTRR